MIRFLLYISVPQWPPFSWRSKPSSLFFIPSPPENPPSVPAELITRCQGMMIGMGFAPIAWPTARAARGDLILFAIQA